MCGIVGMVGDVTIADSLLIRNLLLLDQVRGIDSTGVAQIPFGKDVQPIVEKELGGPTNLWDYGDSQLFTTSGRLKRVGRGFIGHNRAATVGAVDKKSAHPFTFGNITGVHNGTLSEYSDIKHGETFDVDSQYLINSIDKVGIKETWSNFYGAATVVWWDNKEQTLNFIRNLQRPMELVEFKRGRGLAFASEDWMLTQALRMAREQPSSDITTLPVNTHLVITLSTTGFEVVRKDVLTPKAKLVCTGAVSANFTRGTTTTRGTVGINTSRKSDKQPLNTSAFSLLEKGEKDLKEKVFMVVSRDHISPMYYGKNSVGSCYLDAEFEDTKETVRIYPLTEGQRVSLSKLPKNARFIAISRPRKKVNTNGDVDYYAIAEPQTKRVWVKEVVEKKESEKENNVVPLNVLSEKSLKGPDGTPISKQELEKLLSNLVQPNHCDGCNQNIKETDYKNLMWFGLSTVICPDCVESEWMTKSGFSFIDLPINNSILH